MHGLLYGRGLELALVRELMVRPEGPVQVVDGWHPVVVFEGGAAAGKTALLDALAGGCSGQVPYAYLDLESVEAQLGDASIPKLLAALAFQLASRCKLYGSLRFDRLVIGLLVIELELNDLDPDEARSQVLEQLKERRHLTTVKRVLGQVAHDALRVMPLSLMPSSRLVTTSVELVVDWLASWPPTRKRILGRAQNWYSHQGLEAGLDSIDALVELNRLARHHHRPGGARAVDALLWNAFLADLRDNFATGWRADEWSLSCLLLLDNVDTLLGRDFLQWFIQPDEDAGIRGLSVQDPVTIAATSRGGLLSALPKAARASVREVAFPQDALPPARGEPAATVWLRRVLPPLTAGQVQEMVNKLSLGDGNARILTRMLYQLSGGNPGGVRMLLRAVGEGGTALVEPEDLLASGLEEALYQRLLAGIPEDVIETVVTCSAGRNTSEGLGLLNELGQAGLVLLPVGVWDPRPDVHTTLLRLLLLRRLARRPDTHKWNWSATHDTLREASARRDDDVAGELHHMLAEENVDLVVLRLTARLDTDPLPQWLALLDAVTTAPRKPAERSASAVPDSKQDEGYLTSATADDVTGLGEDGGLLALPLVRTLVTARWMVADPVCGSNRSALYWQIAGAYRDLSRPPRDRSEDLIDLIDQYEQLARHWQRRTR